MSGSITLHRELGVNPRLTFCPRCGGDGRDLMLLGNKNYKDVCRSSMCGMVHYGGTKRPGCCDECSCSTDRIELEPNEKLPGGLCKSCEEEIASYEAEFAKGGVAFQCSNCNTSGMIKGDTDFARDVRKHHGAEFTTEPYKKCGVRIPSCPNCRKEEA